MLVNQNIAHKHRFTLIFLSYNSCRESRANPPPIGPLSPPIRSPPMGGTDPPHAKICIGSPATKTEPGEQIMSSEEDISEADSGAVAEWKEKVEPDTEDNHQAFTSGREEFMWLSIKWSK